MNKRMFTVIIAIIFAGGLLIRAFELDSRSLEYDEIWTKANFLKKTAAEIFSNLATPNNHSLHTWCCKTVCSIFGEKTWIFRMTALFFGMATIIAGIWGGKKYLRSKYAQIGLTALLAFFPYLVHYSNTARGYSMQAFFVFAFALGLFSFSRKANWKCGVWLFLFACGALFSVYSGLLFVCAAAGAYVFSFFKWSKFKSELKKSLPLVIAGVLFAVTAALWLGFNHADIASAQQFGFKITSVGHFFRSAGHLIKDLNLSIPLIIIAAAFAIRPKDWYLRFGLIFPALVLVSILFTKCGPERVYMPMIAVVLFCMAHGVEVISRRLRKINKMPLLLWLAVLICMLWNMDSEIERISPPDWNYFAVSIEKNTDDDCYVVYPAGDTMPIAVNYTDAPLNQANRMLKGIKNILFVTPLENSISCLKEDISEYAFKLPAASEVYPLLNNYYGYAYPVEAADENNFRKGEALLCTFLFMPKKQYLKIRERMYENDECLFLNAFFNKDYASDSFISREPLRAVAILIPETSQEYSFYTKLAEAGGGRLRFYVFRK